MAGLSLNKLLPGFPDLTVDKVEYLGNLDRARADGIRKIPGMVCGEQRLSGIFLTKRRIRRFLESL